MGMKRVSQIHLFSSLARKKGASNVGFVLSFMIFILFIIFMFSAIEPFLKTQASKQSLLELLRFSLIDDFKAEDLTIMTIKSDPISPDKPCVSLTNIIGSGDNKIPEEYLTNNQLKIKNDSKNFDYSRSGNSLQIGSWESGDLQTNGFFFKIYYSEALGQTQVILNGCHPIPETDYKIGSLVEEQSQVIESKILDLKDSYESDCGETIKTDLKIPDGNEFTFSFKPADDGTPIEPQGCGGIPNTNVYATEFPVQYLDNNAELQIGYLTIKVW